MKALTLHQPYAYLVSIGAKRFETRSWRTNYRGPLWIHASRDVMENGSVLRFDHEDNEIPAYRYPFDRYLKPDWNWLYGDLSNGGVVALVNLVACDPAHLVEWQLKRQWVSAHPHSPERQFIDEELAFGNFSLGRWAWRLDLVCTINGSGLIRGYQRLWNMPELDALEMETRCFAAGIYPKPSPFPQLTYTEEAA